MERSADVERPTPSRLQTALVVGAGPGLGLAIAQKLAHEGSRVVLVARRAERLVEFARILSETSGQPVLAYGCDATSESSVRELFGRLHDLGLSPDLVVYAVQGFVPGRTAEIEVCAFEESWRQNCLGAFIVGRDAARIMQARGSGTIIFVGSTSGTIARADHLNLAVGKFGMRALAHVMARELWPEGVHVAHLIIDADIRETADDVDERQACPEDVAQAVYALHIQPRSAWTHELDIRPWNERFWEHC